jgi:hypothetical protein
LFRDRLVAARAPCERGNRLFHQSFPAEPVRRSLAVLVVKAQIGKRQPEFQAGSRRFDPLIEELLEPGRVVRLSQSIHGWRHDFGIDGGGVGSGRLGREKSLPVALLDGIISGSSNSRADAENKK